METKKNKSIVVYEFNDKGRGLELDGSKYINSFIEFIESLGFEIVYGHSLSSIKINGYSFILNTDNASYNSKSAFTREINVRKPANRFISIKKLYGEDANILKIHFNKEYDADKLREKINSAIQKINDINDSIIARKNKDKENTIAIAEHFMSKEGFSDIVTLIKIEKSKLHFFTDFFQLIFTTKGEFVSYHIYKNIDKESELDLFLSTTPYLQENTTKLFKILKQNPIDSNLIEWATEAYNRCYNVTKLEYSEY